MTVSEYNKCVDDYADNLYRFVLKNIKDEQKASDIIQDTYEKMWLKRDTIDVKKAKSYMFTAAYHTLIDFTRKEKKQTTFEEVNYNKYSHSDQYSDLQEVLQEAVDKLPKQQKAVILLRDYEGYDYKEIGEITSLTESQVKVYIFRARKFLKNYLVSIDTVLER